MDLRRDIEVVTDEAGLAALWQPWQDLCQRARPAYPFVHPAWLRPWWQVFGTGRPLIAVLRDGAELAGVLPLYCLDDKLLPIGVGVSDYFDVLLPPAAPPGAAECLLAAGLRASDAARLDLPELPEDAILRTAPAPCGWLQQSSEGAACPVLSLQPEPAIPKGMRRDLRQARHRAERAGGWSVETAEPDTLPRLLNELITLHGARWQRRGEPGVLAGSSVLAFHRAAAPALLEAGLLRLQALHLRGRIAAVIYALLVPDRICFYLGGFDPAASFESPGTLLLGHMLEEAWREGRGEAHFLRGGEAYKYAWGGIDRRNACRSLVRP
jgi:CelD/BcsL family acetyltransferase involved in cellulose biosynthesis